MTQSIAFIRCESKEQAEKYKKILDHDLYKFINNICRWETLIIIVFYNHFQYQPI